jgi:DNA-binding transcriptional MerR regulator
MARLTIGALAAQANCNVPTVRYYEEIRLMPQAARGSGGQRVYGQEDVRRLTLIRRCRDFQFPIEQIRGLVDLIENPSRDCNAAKDLAEDHLSAVRSKLRELHALEKDLIDFAGRCASACAGGPARDCVILDDLSSKCCA